MPKKAKKEWRLKDILGFSKYIYTALLLLAIATMAGMVLYGVIKNPSTFENIVIKSYETSGIGLVSAVCEKDGAAQELSVEEALALMAPHMGKKVKEQENFKENVVPEYKITFTSEITENDEKKSVQTLELTFAGEYCFTTDLHYGGDHIYKIGD